MATVKAYEASSNSLNSTPNVSRAMSLGSAFTWTNMAVPDVTAAR